MALVYCRQPVAARPGAAHWHSAARPSAGLNNNNNVPIDILVLTFKSNTAVIDVLTGIFRPE